MIRKLLLYEMKEYLKREMIKDVNLSRSFVPRVTAHAHYQNKQNLKI